MNSAMQASLPMYDLPEIQEVADAWWHGVAKHMKQQGVNGVPSALVRGVPLGDHWKADNLFLSQCCGFNIVHGHKQYLSVLMVTDWDASGCEPNKYSSYFTVHEDSPYEQFSQLKGKIAVINGLDSHSGMTTLMHEAQSHNDDGHFFKAILNSGAHAESLKLIQHKQADIAAIDCVTFALLKRYRPISLEGVRVISRSPTAPAHPYATSATTNLETQQRMQIALAEAFADQGLADLREAMLLKPGKLPDLSDNDNSYQAIAGGFKFDKRLLGELVGTSSSTNAALHL